MTDGRTSQYATRVARIDKYPLPIGGCFFHLSASARSVEGDRSLVTVNRSKVLRHCQRIGLVWFE